MVSAAPFGMEAPQGAKLSPSLIATDYDGTLATHGTMPASTRAALVQWKEQGGIVVLVTGREVRSLERALGDASCFDLIIAENGGVIFDPAKGTTEVIARPLDPDVRTALEMSDIQPVSMGRVVVATMEGNADAVSTVFAAARIAISQEVNKGAVMFLPPGVTKAYGLGLVLERWGLDWDDVVAVGDADNDIAMVVRAHIGVAVANGTKALRAVSNWCTPSPHGIGVEELVATLLRRPIRGPRTLGGAP